jgi:hypothetical protein
MNICDLADVPFFMKQLGSNCMMNVVETGPPNEQSYIGVKPGKDFYHFTGPGKGRNLAIWGESL